MYIPVKMLILCSFGDKRWEMVGHILRINYSAMIAVFMQHLQLGSLELHVNLYCDVWLRCKVHPPNKGCVIRDKTMCLTDEYILNSEVLSTLCT